MKYTWALSAKKWRDPGHGEATFSGWWFQPIWKILINWDDYSEYMENMFQTTKQFLYLCIHIKLSLYLSHVFRDDVPYLMPLNRLNMFMLNGWCFANIYWANPINFHDVSVQMPSLGFEQFLITRGHQVDAWVIKKSMSHAIPWAISISFRSLRHRLRAIALWLWSILKITKVSHMFILYPSNQPGDSHLSSVPESRNLIPLKPGWLKSGFLDWIMNSSPMTIKASIMPNHQPFIIYQLHSLISQLSQVIYPLVI